MMTIKDLTDDQLNKMRVQHRRIIGRIEMAGRTDERVYQDYKDALQVIEDEINERTGDAT